MAEKSEQDGGAITTPRPSRGLADLRQEMSRLWDAFGRPGFPRVRPVFEGQAWPSVDVFERDGSLIVKADVPGLTAKDIEVTVTEDGITISGERAEEKEVKEKDFYRSERSYGRFVRQLPLPAGADRNNADASFKDGVLEICFPLKEEAKQKKIEVKSG
jgi:HSP20 family protein